MLKRSPRSKYFTVALSLACVVIAFIVIDALTTLHSLAHNHGSRVTYYMAATSMSQGDHMNNTDFVAHTMFENDAPTSALTNIGDENFARYDIAKGTIITKAMVTSREDLTATADERIIFVPTKDVITSLVAQRTDLLAVSANGYSADTVATNARILFDVSPHVGDDGVSNPGYFVAVTDDEATQIALALSTGEIHFALRKSSH